jgi:hypothetical protein
MEPSMSFERFLEVFVPGSIVTAGTWYLHRPFLKVHFPAVAADSIIATGTSSTLGTKTVLFLIASICIGVLLNHMWDIAVIGVFEDGNQTRKAKDLPRRLFRALVLPIVFNRTADPRVHAIRRYLESPRRSGLVSMAEQWSASNENRLGLAEEAIVVHQHVTARLNVISNEARSLLSELVRPVAISGSVFLAFFVLVPIALTAFVTSYMVEDDVMVHTWPVLICATLSFYVLSVLASYSLRRSFRHYCAQVITLGLHVFLEQRRDSNCRLLEPAIPIHAPFDPIEERD